MSYDDMAPVADKVLHADGSVKTMAGEVILPADLNRAEDYANRAATADKWLNPDGSVTDMAGRIIMEADESRARDYESRMAGTAPLFAPGGGLTGDGTINDGTKGNEVIGSGFKIDENFTVHLFLSVGGSETIQPDMFLFNESEKTYLPHYAVIRPGAEYVEPNAYPITDTATAVLE